ncbi:MAG: peptide-methionine (S)-S-oxide reductase MsrA [Capsulimonadales bacterium]|nr:peptide-methionine (S)-S-oxide reductase MsrA [Capsulimonadales bacterium]
MSESKKTKNLDRRSALLLTIAALLPGCAVRTEAVTPAPEGQTAQTKKKDKSKMSIEPVPVKVPEGRQIATIAGGCFWCVEAIFQDLKGVDKVVSGYSGGRVMNPTYEQVCSGMTGHAEALQILFDPKVISYRDLLRIFMTTHDPTTLNRQGADVGTQYRSAIFFHDAEQRKVAEEVIREVNAERIYPNPIVTEVTPFTNWFNAEDYHQNYYKSNPNQGYCRMVIEPKVLKFRRKYAQFLRQ